MADKKYPVLYATSIKGTIFRHCGVYNTIYFNIYNNKELDDQPYYLEYMEKTREEVYKAIQMIIRFSLFLEAMLICVM